MKQLSQDARKILKNLCSKLLWESKNRMLHTLSKPSQRAVEYCGLSSSTVARCMKEVKSKGSPKKKSKGKPQSMKCGPKPSLDSFDKNLIERTVKNMLQKNEMVTLPRLQTVLKMENSLNVSTSTLWRVVHQRGFVFKATKGNRKILCQRTDLQVARMKYLRKLKELDEQFKRVYLDETWVNAGHTFKKEWVSRDGSVGRNIPPGKGKRLILLHATTEENLLPDCKLLFESISTDQRDYHAEMNADIFET